VPARGDMTKIVPILGLLILPLTPHAADKPASRTQCLDQIRAESEFIVSRINFVHRSYEKQLSDSGLGQFQSGDYSTSTMLDNSIRKYHHKLVQKILDYPIQYSSRLRGVQRAGKGSCLARQLHEQAVGTIHEFELSWEHALKSARANADYFRHLDGMR